MDQIRPKLSVSKQTFIIVHGFCGSGIWEPLSWVSPLCVIIAVGFLEAPFLKVRLFLSIPRLLSFSNHVRLLIFIKFCFASVQMIMWFCLLVYFYTLRWQIFLCHGWKLFLHVAGFGFLVSAWEFFAPLFIIDVGLYISCDLFVWFWWQGNDSFVKGVGMYCLLFFSRRFRSVDVNSSLNFW